MPVYTDTREAIQYEANANGVDIASTTTVVTDEIHARFARHGWTPGVAIETEQVAQFFCDSADHGLPMEERLKKPSSWAPAASDSFAPVTIGGDIPEGSGKTKGLFHDVTYVWYDLEDTLPGNVIYRITSTRTLWEFTRCDTGRWAVRISPERYDLA